ncbi:MAG TPA: DUF4203 domain-containing protein [Anaerolineales bacterium]|nr:DUF4203 domain-containing protein [Anaerolineales bacterium]
MMFSTLCAILIGVVFGMIVAFNGYKLFLVLLPFWGFFFGFALGAETLQAIFGDAFLATATSWVAGFIVGVIFAVLSYLFWIIGVALFAGSAGYALGVGLMGLIGFDFGLLSWLVGIILAVVVAAVVLLLNLQKWAIVLITAFGGAAVIMYSILVGFSGELEQALIDNPVRFALDQSFLWVVFFLGVGILGLLAQVRNTRNWVLEEPENRF